MRLQLCGERLVEPELRLNGLRASGRDGELWLVGEPTRFRVRLDALEECEGWEWRCGDPALRWWVEASVFDGSGAEVVPESVSLRTGRVTLRRCLRGPLFAEGVCRPVSVAARGDWSLEEPMFVGGRTFEGSRPVRHGTAVASLVADGDVSEGPLDAGLAAAFLRCGYVAFFGLVSVGGRVGRRLSLTFTEGVSYEPV